MVLIGLLVLAVLGAGWILVVSPERQQASKLNAQVSSAQSALSSAEAQLTHARSDQAQYSAAYASVVSLGKAVPPSQEVPSLIYQLAQASNQKDVEFSSITSTSATGPSASTTPSASAPASTTTSKTTATAAASTAAAGSTAAASTAAAFTQMPFTFVFNGDFFDLEHLFHRLDSFASVSSSGQVAVSGRLLTIQSIKLTPTSTDGTPTSGSHELSGTITATAYELPAGQGLTGSASSAAPGAVTPTAASPTGSSSPTAPAIARVTP
jgi:Tfp pilus assembly protein PilO